MARIPSKTLTEVEHRFMEVLWDRGEADPETMIAELAGRGHDLSGGATRKMLLILLDKGYVNREKQGRKYVYRPSVPRDNAQQSMARELMDRAFGGSAVSLVAALFGGEDVPAEDLGRIEQLIEDYKREEGKS